MAPGDRPLGFREDSPQRHREHRDGTEMNAGLKKRARAQPVLNKPSLSSVIPLCPLCLCGESSYGAAPIESASSHSAW
jgi:hypothetical protein